MMQEKIVRGDLMFHSAHGVCRVNDLIKEDCSGKEVLSYSLVPKMATRMKVRFVIADSDLEISGFHHLVSIKEANEILEYLKAGDVTTAQSADKLEIDDRSIQENHPWSLAKGILSSSYQELNVRDQRKRQVLSRAAKGLVEELAFVFKITFKEAAVKIRKCLAGISRVNPLVLSALEQAGGS